MSKTFDEIVNYRRAVRNFDPSIELVTEKVKHCIELATLAPASSNMQLWEFYHITDEDMVKKISAACLNQQAARTAKQMVVFVTRPDLYQKRAKAILTFEKENIKRYSPSERVEPRIKRTEKYYGQLMPFLYGRFFGLYGFLRKTLTTGTGLFRPIVHEVTENDLRVVVHKTCALAAQTFMLAMSDAGYDTCPLEGFDSRLVKKALKLPGVAEINMVIPCGVRLPDGVHGDRFRVPFSEVYRKI